MLAMQAGTSLAGQPVLKAVHLYLHSACHTTDKVDLEWAHIYVTKWTCG